MFLEKGRGFKVTFIPCETTMSSLLHNAIHYDTNAITSILINHGSLWKATRYSG